MVKKKLLGVVLIAAAVLVAISMPGLTQVPKGGSRATLVRDGGYVQVPAGGSVTVSPASGQGTNFNQFIDFAEMTAPSLSASGHSRIFMNSATHGLAVSINGGAVGAFPGTTSSVDLSLPNIFTVSGNPVTTSGTLTATLATQAKNLIWAGPASGSNAAPTFRAQVDADLPVDVPQNAPVTVATGSVLTLHGTPVTLVAAPGSGKIVVIDHIVAKLVFNSIAYTGSNNLEFRYTDGSGAKVTADMASSFINSSSGTNYDMVRGVTTELTPVANAAVVVVVPVANPGAGNSPIVFTVQYHIITP